MSRADLKREVLRGIFQGAAPRYQIANLTVGAVMTPHPFAVSPGQSARELVQLFHEKRFRHFLVSDAGKLVGVISDRDVIRLYGVCDTLEPDYLEKVTAAELMSTDLICTSSTAPLAQAVSQIVDQGIHCLPVVEDGAAIGILTSTDIFLSLEQLLLCALRREEVASV